MQRNILYSLIAHCDRSTCRIIGDYTTEDKSIYRDIVLEVVSSVRSTENEKISIQRGKYTVHLLIGELRYAALTITPDGRSSPSEIASSSQIFLERLRCVYRELPILADLSRELHNFSIIDLSAPLKKILDEFNGQDIDCVPKLEEELAEVRRVLMESVQKLIDRGQRLDELVRKTQTLEITVRRDFRLSHRTTSSKKKKGLVVTATSIAIITSTLAVDTLTGQMASCGKFSVHRKQLWDDIKSRDDDAESKRIISFVAARKIQAWFRGIATRNHIRTLNAMATVIQRHWRGCRGRCFAKKFLFDRVNSMWESRYDLSARRIQAAWREYRTRKTGFNIYRANNWVSSVHEKNEYTRGKMRSFREDVIQWERNQIENESLQWILFILFKLHHLLGTKHRDGIVTSIDRTYLANVERMIKCLEYSVYVENKRMKNLRCKDREAFDKRLLSSDARSEGCEANNRNFVKNTRMGKHSIRERERRSRGKFTSK